MAFLVIFRRFFARFRTILSRFLFKKSLFSGRKLVRIFAKKGCIQRKNRSGFDFFEDFVSLFRLGNVNLGSLSSRGTWYVKNALLATKVTIVS